MPLPRPRLTISRMMALVAILALILGLSVLGWRWNSYRRQAEHHEEVAAVLRNEIAVIWRAGDEARAVEVRTGALAEEEWEARRYHAAARRPWLAVPDGGD